MKPNSIILLVILITNSQRVISQVVNNVDYKVDDDKITLTYDLNSEEDIEYRLRIKFKEEQGQLELTPKSISGDIKKVRSGKNKMIIWYVTEDLDSIEGSFKAVVTIVPRNVNRHVLLFDTKPLLTVAGFRYAHLAKVGGYFSVSTDFGAIDNYLICTAGISYSVNKKIHPYLGGGLELNYNDIIAELGLMLNLKKVILNLGFGTDIYKYQKVENPGSTTDIYSVLPFVNLGIGISLNY